MEKNEYVHPLFIIWASATWEADRPFALIEFTQIIFKEEFKEIKEYKKESSSKITQKRAYEVFVRKAKDMPGDPDSRELPFLVAAGRMMNQIFKIKDSTEACAIAKKLSYVLFKFRNSLDTEIKGYCLRKDNEFWYRFFKGLHVEEDSSNKSEEVKAEIKRLLEKCFLDGQEEKLLIHRFFRLIIKHIFPGATFLNTDDFVLEDNGYLLYVIYLSNEVLKAWIQYHEFQERTKSSTDLTTLEEKFIFYDTLDPITFKSGNLPEYRKFFEVRFLPQIDSNLALLELEQLDSIMEILEIVSDKENGPGKKKIEIGKNDSRETKDQKDIYNSYISRTNISQHSALTNLSPIQREGDKNAMTSKGLLSLTPKSLPNSLSQPKKKFKFVKNRESKEEIPLCAVSDGKQTVIYNIPFSEMENFVKSIRKGRNLEDTAMLMMIWNKTRELNMDWALKGEGTSQHTRTLEYALDISKL